MSDPEVGGSAGGDEVKDARVHAEAATTRLLRHGILGAMCFALVGTEAELLLLEHTEDRWQLVPIVLLPLALLLTLGVWIRPGRRLLRVFRGVMALLLGAAAVGVYLHYDSNREFELEMYPSRSGFELFVESMMGAMPTLAPGSLGLLGFLGVVATLRHPGGSAPAREHTAESG